MSERMRKILEAGEENRQADIELGRSLERERIVELLKGSVMTEHQDWLVSLIEEQN
jgi:hypothetical protein